MRDRLFFFIVTLMACMAMRGQQVSFYSEEFGQGIRLHLGLMPTDEVSQSQMDTITAIDLSALEITDIRDAVYLPQVRTINLSYNRIADLSSLLQLDSLRSVNLSYNELESVSVLALAETEQLSIDVTGNHISDFSFFFFPSSCQFTLLGMNIQPVKYASDLLGDVNCDDIVTISDLTKLVNILIGNETPSPEADVNRDGTIDEQDLSALLDIMLLK